MVVKVGTDKPKNPFTCLLGGCCQYMVKRLSCQDSGLGCPKKILDIESISL